MRRLVSRSCVLALAWLAFASEPTAARELWRSGDAYLDASGSVREIAVWTRGTSQQAFEAGAQPACFSSPVNFANCPAFDAVGDERVFTSLTRLRLRVEGRASPHWSAVVSFDNELLAGDLDTFEARFSEELGANTFVDAAGQVGSDPVSYRYSLYRGYLNFESERFEAAIGRQRIPWGVARLWNPIDRFNAIRPLAIQPDESRGVDAVNARILFSGFNQLELVFAAGRESRDHDYAARFQGVARDIDFGFVVGVFDAATTVGADLAANLGEAAGRAEIVYTHPTRDVWPVGAPGPSRLDDFWQLVVSIDYNLDWGSGVYLLAEHLYNGNALGFGAGKAGPLLPFFEEQATPPFYVPTSPDRFGGSQVITRSEQLTGFQAAYELIPELRLTCLAIYDWQGESAVFFPSLSYAPLGWLDLTLGVQAAVGGSRSEFGGSPTTAFLLADFFF